MIRQSTKPPSPPPSTQPSIASRLTKGSAAPAMPCGKTRPQTTAATATIIAVSTPVLIAVPWTVIVSLRAPVAASSRKYFSLSAGLPVGMTDPSLVQDGDLTIISAAGLAVTGQAAPR